MRPGLHFEELLEEAFPLVDEGKFGEDGPHRPGSHRRLG
jgi:hypothetical protein